MPITQQQKQEAETIQHRAAHDTNGQVRLVAGPGTGKTYAIEERVRWLLAQGVSPSDIAVVSFTRAAARDLEQRVRVYCVNHGQMNALQVRVSTLHSLALRILSNAGFLSATYPVPPMVLDGWEVENIFDAEFSNATGIKLKRCRYIRRHHEAYWNTAVWDHPIYIPPKPPVTTDERRIFGAFHGARTQVYSCVLPGEIIRQCVERLEAGTLSSEDFLQLSHLVIDEFQDLNPCDLHFVDRLIQSGITTFVAGDDDQSIYSFRFASPEGIQRFPQNYPESSQHFLGDCFRCAPAIVDSAVTLIEGNALPNRIAKPLSSLYSSAQPPIGGKSLLFRHDNGGQESRAIALTCRRLIERGINPDDILILICNRTQLLAKIDTALQDEEVPHTSAKYDAFKNTSAGRYLLALCRFICRRDDYVALRTLLGLKRGVGIGTCDGIAVKVIEGSLNFGQTMTNPLPGGIFTVRETRAIDSVRSLIESLGGWEASDTLGQRLAGIREMILGECGECDDLLDTLSTLPDGVLLEELRDYIWADNDEQSALVLSTAYDRMGLDIPAGGILPSRVRVMTMHGAKGLSAKVVFIPGLEEGLMPNQWSQPYPGLVLEAARMLYVSVTRARLACVISYARRRTVFGRSLVRTPSRFLTQLGISATAGSGTGLSDPDVLSVIEDNMNL